MRSSRARRAKCVSKSRAGGITVPGQRKTWPLLAGGAALLVIIVVAVFAFGGDSETAAIAPLPPHPVAPPPTPAPVPPAPPSTLPSAPAAAAPVEPDLSAVRIDSVPSGAALVMDGAI